MTIRLRKNGRYMIDLRHNGRRLRLAVPDTMQNRRGAEQYERQVLADLERGIMPCGTEGTDEEPKQEVPRLRDMWERFAAFQASNANRRTNRPSTIDMLAQTFHAYLTPHVGDLRVDKIDARAIDDLAVALERGSPDAKGKRRHRALKPNTIANALGLLRRMLNVAKRWGYVAEVPEIHARKVAPDKIEDDEWLTEAEIAALLDALDPRWRRVVAFAVRTGLRLGELQALRYGDIDGARVIVRRTWLTKRHRSAGMQEAEGPTKGGRSRTVPLHWQAADAVGNGKRDAFVFTEGPVPFKANELQRALDRATKAAGLKHVHPHMLRHTFASHAVMAGVPSRVLMSWGGWKSEAMLARYAHLAGDQVDEMIHRIAPAGAGLRVVAGGAAPADRGHTTGTRAPKARRTAL